MGYRDKIPKVQLYEDLWGMPQPNDIKGLDKGLSQILGEAGGYQPGKIYDRRWKNILRPLGEAGELLYGGIGAMLDAPYKTIREPLKYLFSENPVIQEAQKGTPEGIDLAKIPNSGVGRPDWVPDDYQPGTITQGFAPEMRVDPDNEYTLASAFDDYEDATDFLSVADKMKKMESKKWKDEQASRDDQEKGGVLTEKSAGETTGETTGEDTADSFETLFNASMSSYGAAQGQEDTGKKTLEDYKKEFAKATGLDVSGKPDKSNALMALGLALMQNKAGKGFDVGKMLGAVGEAGEKALPAFTKAKQEAKLAAAKAGEYALGKVDEDEAEAKLKAEEMRERTNMYIIPKGDKGGPLSVVDAMMKGKGEFKPLNKYELAHLHEDEDFMSKFDIVDASKYDDILAEAMKTPDAKKNYQQGKEEFVLFNDSDIKLSAQVPDFNVAPDGFKPKLFNSTQALATVAQLERGLVTAENKFKDIANLLNQTGISWGSQARSIAVQLSRNAGIPLSDDTDPVKQLQTLLTELSAKEAANILGESGKTLSDTDRRLVSTIVGEINWFEADEKLLKRKLNRLFTDIVGTRRNQIRQSYETLASFGININRETTAGGGSGDWSYNKEQDYWEIV